MILENEGWVKLYRKIESSAVFQSEGLLKVWIWCLIRASHEDQWAPISTGRGKTEVLIKRGQFLFGRKTAAKALKMDENTVYKRMMKLKSMGNCNIQSNTHYSIVSVVNWDIYQVAIEKSNTQSNTQVTGKYQASNTYKNDKNEKNEEKKEKDIVEQARRAPSSSASKEKDKTTIPYQEIIDFLNKESGKNFKANSKATRSMIKARWDEGHQLEDFKEVITKKCAKWKNDPKMDDYLRPATLFRPSNFESYLNERDGHELTTTKREEPKARLWGTEWPSFRDDEPEAVVVKTIPRTEVKEMPSQEQEEGVKEMAKRLAESKRMPNPRSMTEAEAAERKARMKQEFEEYEKGRVDNAQRE